jgi:hypothetical protein
MTAWKIVQRHTYDLLSRKYSIIIILICISTIIVSIFQFGEVSSAQDRFEASRRFLVSLHQLPCLFSSIVLRLTLPGNRVYNSARV